jgi:hypothetical protein
MPIRINLLAEQQEAEEARRRDPVKRALWAGGGLVALMILWAVSLQMRLSSARAELSRYDARMIAVEENSKEARADWAAAAELERRIGNLQRYSTNRFFSANLLDALQHVVVDDVRIVQLQTLHAYGTNAESNFKTNLVFPVASRKTWQFWHSRQSVPDVSTLLSNQLALITNKVPALKSPVGLITKIDLSTNRQQVTAKVEIKKPATAREQVVLTIKARDYGNPPGRRVDEFSKAVATYPYFAERLRQTEGEGVRLSERAIQPETDQTDPVNPNKPFVSFVIECRYQETLRPND